MAGGSSGDVLRRFLIESAGVRGVWLHLDAAWQELRTRSGLPPSSPVAGEPVAQRLLGEAVLATLLMKAGLKIPARVTLQVQGAGALRLLVAQASTEGQLRALVHAEDDLAQRGFGESGSLVMTLEPLQPRRAGERYQGIVALTPDPVARPTRPGLVPALEDYFARSEQLPTRLWLEVTPERAAGLLLQRLPGDADGIAVGDADGWTRIQALADTLRGEELLLLEGEQLLQRLFFEETVRLFPGEAQGFHCGCSPAPVESMLRAMPVEELRELQDTEGKVVVRCEFCGAEYRFDAVDVGWLAAEEGSGGPGSARSQ